MHRFSYNRASLQVVQESFHQATSVPEAIYLNVNLVILDLRKGWMKVSSKSF